jgi:hypothetical protein
MAAKGHKKMQATEFSTWLTQMLIDTLFAETLGR